MLGRIDSVQYEKYNKYCIELIDAAVVGVNFLLSGGFLLDSGKTEIETEIQINKNTEI